MKSLKICMAVIIVMTIIIPLTVQESQAVQWYTCYVNKVGGGDTGKYIMLTESSAEPVFSQVWYQLDSSSAANTSAQYALGLTAMASNLKVWAYVDPNGGTITWMYLLDQ